MSVYIGLCLYLLCLTLNPSTLCALTTINTTIGTDSASWNAGATAITTAASSGAMHSLQGVEQAELLRVRGLRVCVCACVYVSTAADLSLSLSLTLLFVSRAHSH